MTATQVFLRFIENEYRREDGTVDDKMFKLWRNEIRENNISSKISPNGGIILMYTSYGGIRYEPVKVRRSKNFVDDYLNGASVKDIGESVYGLRYRKRTLRGFMSRFILFNRYLSYARPYGGWSYTETTKRIIRHWHDFLDKHIENNKKYVLYGQKVEYEWKD